MTAWIDPIIDDRQVLQTFARLMAVADSPKDLYTDWGEALIKSTRDRNNQQISPDGTPLTPLNPKYAQRRQTKYGDRPILNREFHMLGDRFNYFLADPGLVVGTTAKQARVHQYGFPARHIPARPWLGFSDHDLTELRNILARHLRAVIRV